MGVAKLALEFQLSFFSCAIHLIEGHIQRERKFFHISFHGGFLALLLRNRVGRCALKSKRSVAAHEQLSLGHVS